MKITSTVDKHEKGLKHLAIANDTHSRSESCSSCNKYRVEDHNVDVNDLDTWFGNTQTQFDIIDRIVHVDGIKLVVRNSSIIDNNIFNNNKSINHQCAYLFINKIEFDTDAVNNWFSLPTSIHTSDGIFKFNNDQETY